jgi:DNA-directed RNA polymerase specialized sigma24 family protein
MTTRQNQDDAQRQPAPAKPKRADKACNDGPRADQGLVTRCLAGDQRAWEQLYEERHPPLVEAIKLLLGPYAKDMHLVDEIAARVWYALLRDDARLLSRYDAQRESRLGAFLMGLAQIEIMRHVRAERRRQTHEFQGGQRILVERRAADMDVSAMLREFVSLLTPPEQEFLEKYLLDTPQTGPDAAADDMSATNIWQRRHRIRLKLMAYLR